MLQFEVEFRNTPKMINQPSVGFENVEYGFYPQISLPSGRDILKSFTALPSIRGSQSLNPALARTITRNDPDGAGNDREVAFARK